ncbi:flavin monoamine oxidase family protein [Yinghuangia soli]|uniref:FAD-dependent oxidoreductase n=1 Tax=Yinghuangia soli TaxID=2908204 RepID=A0AA41U428_9ACTN|nr:FAD-dependent oxidoreductase [Yinghuangia soli]MCF2528644.1 FAD-dependent oxidoreductase [Yinghuangia soli]
MAYDTEHGSMPETTYRTTHETGQSRELPHGESPFAVASRRAFLTSAGAAAALPAVGALFAPGTAAATTPVREPDPERWKTCVAVARQLLLVGPADEDLKLKYLRILIDDGLPKTTAPKHVLIVGAGIAGLVAGLLLKRAGHKVTIVEANANRIGGRIKTFRSGPGGQDSARRWADPKATAEAGAMRLPSFHPMTLALIDKLGLKRRPFHLVDVAPGTGNPGGTPPAVEYKAFTGETWRYGPAQTDFRAPDKRNNTWIRANGVRMRKAEYAAAPDAMHAGFGLPAGGGTMASRWANALTPCYAKIAKTNPDGTREPLPLPQRIEGWARLINDYDEFSLRRFMAEVAGFDTATIEALGTLENLTSRLPLSFLHSFLGHTDINPSATYWEIAGGTAELPYALLPELEDDIVMNRRVTRLEYRDTAVPGSRTTHLPAGGKGVWVHTVREAGGDDQDSGTELPGGQVYEADVAIVTIPFSALRHVQVEPAFSYPKRRAIAELHYDAATKVLLEFSRRWWEFDEDQWKKELESIRPGLYELYRTNRAGKGAELLGAHSSVDRKSMSPGLADRYASAPDAAVDQPPAVQAIGGGSVSDNANRFMYHPSHPTAGGSAGGVVLASYTWADDALRWDSLDDDERYAYALRGLQEVYGRRIEVFFTGHGATQSWLRNRYACGEAAVFTPGQWTTLHPATTTVEGPVHFAGEHTSLKHAWIEGSLESAVRAALEVNGRA